MGTLNNDPVVVVVPDQPLQFPSSSSVEFFNIKLNFYRVVTRPRLAPLEVEADPIELYSGLVPVEQFNELQKVTDFLSPMLIRVGAQVEQFRSIVSQFLCIIQSGLSNETSADYKELPIRFALIAVSARELETEEEVRVVATEIGLPSIVLENGLEGDQRCVICLSELLSGCRETHLPCSHVYHTHCILKWLYRKQAKPTCPLCRHHIPVASATDKGSQVSRAEIND